MNSGNWTPTRLLVEPSSSSSSSSKMQRLRFVGVSREPRDYVRIIRGNWSRDDPDYSMSEIIWLCTLIFGFLNFSVLPRHDDLNVTALLCCPRRSWRASNSSSSAENRRPIQHKLAVKTVLNAPITTISSVQVASMAYLPAIDTTGKGGRLHGSVSLHNHDWSTSCTRWIRRRCRRCSWMASGLCTFPILVWLTLTCKDRFIRRGRFAR